MTFHRCWINMQFSRWKNSERNVKSASCFKIKMNEELFLCAPRSLLQALRSSGVKTSRGFVERFKQARNKTKGGRILLSVLLHFYGWSQEECGRKYTFSLDIILSVLELNFTLESVFSFVARKEFAFLSFPPAPVPFQAHPIICIRNLRRLWSGVCIYSQEYFL